MQNNNKRLSSIQFESIQNLSFYIMNSLAQTDAEIDTLVESYKDLQDAKQKFKESLDSIKIQRDLPNDKSILVPLTGSMYVPGHISNTNEFLLDIGTQYLVEKDADGAIDYFERKMKFIDVQLAKFSQLLQTRLQTKQQATAQAAVAAQVGVATSSTSRTTNS